MNPEEVLGALAVLAVAMGLFGYLGWLAYLSYRTKIALIERGLHVPWYAVPEEIASSVAELSQRREQRWRAASVLVVVGVVLLVGNMAALLGVPLGDLFLVLLGVLSLGLYSFYARTTWFLAAGCVLSLAGVVTWAAGVGLVNLNVWWGLFPLSVGLGLLATYLVEWRVQCCRPVWALYTGGVMAVYGSILFLHPLGVLSVEAMNALKRLWDLWPAALIVIGVIWLRRLADPEPT